MGGARLLDDLARALVEPMPRRRALRLLGASVAALAVPGFGPATARAAPAHRSATCGPDRRTCQKGAEANFEPYCCPAPSWQFFCGGQDTRYACVNVCPGPGKFPCTALIADRYAGRNGVCCDTRLHSGCNQAVKDPEGRIIRTSGGGSLPQCIPEKPCPDGRKRCRDTCCSPKARCVPRVVDTADGLDRNPKRGQCCSAPASRSCGSTCCPANRRCCRSECCPPGDVCASALDRDRCCPRNRFLGTLNGTQVCCGPGTVRTGHGGCCPPGQPDCCPPLDANGHPIDCTSSGKICHRGRCVNP